MNNSLSPVTFHGDTIFCFTYQNQPYTAMKPIIENMGLDWRSQAAKLRSNKERWGVAMFTTPTSSGEQEMTCMPVRKLPAFLNTINPKKVRPELRERIELYQTESDDVLWEYWTNQQAMRDTPTGYLSVEERRPLVNLIAQWSGKARMSFPDCWRDLHAVFGISSVSDLPAAQLPAALAWVQAKIDALSPSVHSDIHSDVHSDVPTELAAYGHRKNFWKELEDARAKLGFISSVIDVTLPQSYSHGDRQNALLCDTLSSNVQVAHNCLVVAQQALKAALSLKYELTV